MDVSEFYTRNATIAYGLEQGTSAVNFQGKFDLK